MVKTETAIFGGGCFWCTEAIFTSLKGVDSVLSGYAGGTTSNPTYEEVCSGKTGHAEVIKIEFDPEVISYNDLLEIFFELHDPTSLNRQGHDVGEQYRSIIIYTSDQQKQQAEAYIKMLDEFPQYKNKIVTEVKALDAFYPAEKYNQNYYNNYPEASYCQVVISPKLTKLRQKFSNMVK